MSGGTGAPPAVATPLLPANPIAQTIHNERVRLLASGLNIVAAGLFITGVIAPLTGFGTGTKPDIALDEATLGTLELWIFLALVAHGGAQYLLRYLR